MKQKAKQNQSTMGPTVNISEKYYKYLIPTIEVRMDPRFKSKANTESRVGNASIRGWAWWFMPIISTTRKAQIRRITV
jgi:hypothetical protein